MTTRVETSRELAVPVETAYAQWTQFEDLPLYMGGVEEVEQLADDRVRITYKRRGVSRTWEARITEQIPDARIAWQSETDEPEHAGVVTFHRLAADHSKVMVQFDFWPNGFFEHYADKIGLVEQFVDKALDDFEAFIEKRKRPTGSWDGLIGRDDLEADSEHTTSGEAHTRSAAVDETPTGHGTATDDGERVGTTAFTASDPAPPEAEDRVSDPRVPSPEPTLAERSDEPARDAHHGDATPSTDLRPDAHETDVDEPVSHGSEVHDREDRPVRTMADGEIVVEDDEHRH
jgi:uncharacterized protein YndB with AHSA1/START domain